MLWKEVANLLLLSLKCLMMSLELSTSRGGNGFLFLPVPGTLVGSLYPAHTPINIPFMKYSLQNS